MNEYLLRRIDRPLAWVVAFLGPAVFAGAVTGWTGEMPGGVLGGVALVGGFGIVGGLFIGSLVWVVCRLVGGLDRPARRPDRWAQPVRCIGCGWRTSPDGPATRRDCLCPPAECPSCGKPLLPFIPDCPRCGKPMMTGTSVVRDLLRLVRWPRTWGQAFRGHYRCRACGQEHDRWGRQSGSSGTGTVGCGGPVATSGCGPCT